MYLGQRSLARARAAALRLLALTSSRLDDLAADAAAAAGGGGGGGERRELMALMDVACHLLAEVRAAVAAAVDMDRAGHCSRSLLTL